MISYTIFIRELFDYVQDADFGRAVVTNYYKKGQQNTNDTDAAFAAPYLERNNAVTKDCVSVAPVLPEDLVSKLPTSSGNRQGVLGATGFCIPAETLYDIYRAVADDRGEKYAWLGVNAFIRKGLECFESAVNEAIEQGIKARNVSLDYNELLQIVDGLSDDQSPPMPPEGFAQTRQI